MHDYEPHCLTHSTNTYILSTTFPSSQILISFPSSTHRFPLNSLRFCVLDSLPTLSVQVRTMTTSFSSYSHWLGFLVMGVLRWRLWKLINLSSFVALGVSWIFTLLLLWMCVWFMVLSYVYMGLVLSVACCKKKGGRMMGWLWPKRGRLGFNFRFYLRLQVCGGFQFVIYNINFLFSRFQLERVCRRWAFQGSN